MANQTGPVATGEFARGEAAGLAYRWRDAGTRAPLIVFLHGAGERGADNASQVGYPFFAAPDSLFAATRRRCHVLAPQAPTDDKWVEVPRWDAEVRFAPKPSRAMAGLMSLVESTMRRPDVDGDRVYLAGLSMGAFGVYDLLRRRPELAAAAVAVCGAGDPTQASVYKHVPLWIAHGALDKGVPVDRSRAMNAALRAAGAAPVYREYADLGHDAWNRTFTEPDLTPWLLARSRA